MRAGSYRERRNQRHGRNGPAYAYAGQGRSVRGLHWVPFAGCTQVDWAWRVLDTYGEGGRKRTQRGEGPDLFARFTRA
jgi:hypothetical protein